MAGLETRVREALINQRADDLCRTLFQPEYKPVISQFIKDITDSMFAALAQNADGEERAEMRRQYEEQFVPEIEAGFASPEKLREEMYKSAKNEYTSVTQLERELREQITEMREIGISERTIVAFQRAYAPLLELKKMGDLMVKRMTKIAEEKGIDSVLQKETKYAITREIFPTREEYMEFVQKGLEVGRNFFGQLRDIFLSEGERGQIFGFVMGEAGKVMEKSLALSQKINGDYLEKAGQEIYG